MALNSVVVSDSTTLISLLNIDRFELLFKFSNTIIITQAVYDKITFRKNAKKIIDNYAAILILPKIKPFKTIKMV